MEHQIKVTIDGRDGLMAVLVCIDHEADECGPRMVYDWDWLGAMEGYFGPPLTLGVFDITVLTAHEDDGFEWQLEPSN